MQLPPNRLVLGHSCAASEKGLEPTNQLRLDESLLDTHMAIFGGTRMGKSRFYEQICRQLVQRRRGFCFIDPHSDTADDLFAFLAHEQESLGVLRHNIHYLKPDEKLFTFDPFHYEPPADGQDSDKRYFRWLHAKVRDVQGIITRALGESEQDQLKQMRVSRWMNTILTAIAIRHDETGTHYGLEEGLILLQPEHLRHIEVVNRVLPLLGQHEDTHYAHSDLNQLLSIRDPYKREQFVESSIGRFRFFLSPIIRRIFHPQAERLDLRKILASNGVILASLGKTNEMHETDGRVIGGLLIRELLAAARTVEREARNQMYLFVDEAQNYLGEDFDRILKEGGKYKLSLCLAVQTLNNLKHGEVEMLETVMGQCGCRVSFKQQHKPVAEIIAADLSAPLLNFTPLVHQVQQHAGYDIALMRSTGRTESETSSVTVSASKTRGRSRTESDSEMEGENWGENSSRGRTDSGGSTEGGSQSSAPDAPSSTNWGTNAGSSDTSSYGSSTGGSSARTKTNSVGTNESETSGESKQSGRGNGRSETLGETLKARYKLVDQETGQLLESLPIQEAKHTNLLQRLPPQHCLLSVANLDLSIVLRVADVFDPFERRNVSPEWRQKLVNAFKQQVFTGRPYYFDEIPVPELVTTVEDVDAEQEDVGGNPLTD